MHVAVVGSRTWTDQWTIYQALEDIWTEWLGNQWPSEEHPAGVRGDPDMHVISGGAKGADSIGVDWAIVNWVPFTEIKPEWRDAQGRYNPRAGFERNTEIVRAVDVVLAFQVGDSRGTQDSINKANRMGVPVITWRV